MGPTDNGCNLVFGGYDGKQTQKARSAAHRARSSGPRMIKKIGKLAEARCESRFAAVRWLLEQSLDSGFVSALLRQVRGRRMADRIALAQGAKTKAEAAQAAADRDPNNAEAQAKASQAKREAINRERAVTDPQYARFSRRPLAKVPLTPSRQLSEAELRPAADGTTEQLAALTIKGKRGARHPAR